MIRLNGGTLAERVAHLDGIPGHDIPHGMLCDLMNQHGSNKADRVNHAYTPFYAALLRDESVKLVFEAGIGSQKPSMPYQMRAHNVPGGSLRAWREFFPNVQIFGADLDPDVLFSEERIETFPLDILSVDSIRGMWSSIQQRLPVDARFDLIVDDAHHSFRANTTFFANSFEMLRPGGIFIIEDLDTHHNNDHHTSRMASHLQDIEADAIVVEIPGPNMVNNAFAAILKH
jgi:SAM-dependent methyltransferase